MKYGVREEEIKTIHEADFNMFKNAISEEADGLISANWLEKKKTFIFVYYAGHGIMQNMTKVVCNTAARRARIFYPLEANLRALGHKKGAYVMGVFDCCRAAFVDPHRGGGQQAQEEGEDDDDYRNCFLIFGCKPNSTVAAVSTVATEFF
jgi:hypothetical protein